MPACVYIDGFALYHQCFRHSAGRNHLKWLDLYALAAAILPNEEISVVRYYTARVGDTPEDPQRASRQDTFLRALSTLPGLVIREGQFVKSKRVVRLVHPPANVAPQQSAWVRQEKRSDVSLATDLLLDAFSGNATVALVITNDSDFEEPLRIVRDQFGIHVVVISPDIPVSKRLAKVASFARPLDPELLERCQMPDIVFDANGREIRRPAAWTLGDAHAMDGD
ncbi:MAG: NYN domain-containing protein [Thermomicrobiales bacterium]